MPLEDLPAADRRPPLRRHRARRSARASRATRRSGARRVGWTDVNDNDPGITLAQVFAWHVGDAAVPDEPGAGAELHQVPAADRHRAAAGRAARGGGHPSPSMPAHASADVVLRAAAHAGHRRSRRRRPAARSSRRARAARVARAARRSARLRRPDYTTSRPRNQRRGDRRSSRSAPRARRARSLRSGFEDPGPLPAERARSRGSSCRGDTFSGLRRMHLRRDAARLARRRCAGSTATARGWRALDAAQGRDARVHAHRPRAAEAAGQGHSGTAKTSVLAVGPGAALLDARAGRAKPVRAAAELLAIRTNTVAVEQAETIRDEVLGGSDGSRNQRFRLANSRCSNGSLQLEDPA